ncbi:MAG: S8 family serine peptidase [Candidatus Levybacteria bacterium]|nr:S8 family serine peptidase [Candidatus Levybacteria bacterium]
MEAEEPKQTTPEMQASGEKALVQQDVPPKQKRKINVIGLISIIVLFLLITGIILLASMSKTEQDIEQHAAETKTNFTERKRERLKNTVTGRIVVKRKQGIAAATVDAAITRKFKTKTRKNLPQTRTKVLDVPAGQENAIIAALKQNPMIEYVGPVAYATVNFEPNDPEFINQYGLKKISAPSAWDITKGNGVKVAIVDTGIDTSHEDLSGKVTASKNFTSDSEKVTDDNGHGTHMAGIVSAVTDNKIGIAGTCPDCKLIIAKAMGADGKGTSDVISEGIIWAADQGAQVINASLSIDANQQIPCEALLELKDAVDYAHSKGAVFIASAGNDKNAIPHYPGAFDNAIAVAATDKNDKMWTNSNYGSDWVDIAAPGAAILSTVPPGKGSSPTGRKGYAFYDGTSMAAPHVAGVAALLFANGLSSKQVVSELLGTADKIDGTGELWQNGRLNAAKAVGAKPQDEPKEKTQSAGKRTRLNADPTEDCIDETTPNETPTKSPPPPGDDGKKPTPTPGTGQPLATPTFVCLASPNCGLTGTPPPDALLTLTPGGPGTPPPGTLPPDWLTILQERLAEMRRRLQEAAEELRQRMEELRNRMLQLGEQIRERTQNINVPARPSI